MADNVFVSSLSTGVAIGAENIGGVDYQRVKLLGGTPGDTTGIGASGTLPVGVMGSVQVSGAISVSGTAVVTIPGGISLSIGSVGISGVVPVTTQASVSVSGLPVWFATGAVVTLAGSQQVSGAVSISAMPPIVVSGVVPVTTQTSVSISGLPVWFTPGALVAVSGSVLISGPVSISAMPVVSATGVLVSVLSTGNVAVTNVLSATGVLVSTVSGTVNVAVAAAVSVSGITPVTTQTSVSISGVPVWFAPGAVVTLAGVQQISGAISISALPAVQVSGITPVTTQTSVSISGLPVWFAPGAVVTLAGAQQISGAVSISAMPGVSIVNVVPVTTQTSVSVTGLPVWFSPGALVAISASVQVSGAVSISAMPVVSATGVLVSIISTGNVAVTNVLSATGVLVSTVSGTINVNVVAGGAAPGTTVTTQTAITAQLVWLAQSQTLVSVATVGTVLGVVAISGAISVSAMPGVSIVNVVPVTTQTSVSVTGLPVWFAPGAIVTLAGTAGISGPVSISAMPGVSIVNIVPVTTAASVSVTGLPVWLNPTQSVTISGTVNVNVVAGGAAPGTTFTGQTSNTAQLVWLAASQTLVSVATVGTIVTILGTQVVTIAQTSVVAAISGATPVTTQTSVSISGVPVWFAPGALVAASTAFSITGTSISVVVSGAVSVSALPGVSIVNVVPITTQTSVSVTGLPVWFSPGALVALSGIAGVTTQTSVSVTGIPVWFNQTAALGTVVTLLGTAVVTIAQTSVVAAISGIAVVTTQTSVSISGLPVWFAPNALIAISGIANVTTAASVSVTGYPVWLNPTQSVVANFFPVGGYFNAVVTATSISSGAASSSYTLLMTVYDSTNSTQGISGWTIGAGSVLAIYSMGFGYSAPAQNVFASVLLFVTTSGATISTCATPAWAVYSFTNNLATSSFISGPGPNLPNGWTPGGSFASNSLITTISFPLYIPGPAVVGLGMYASSSSSGTVMSSMTFYVSIAGAILNTMPMIEPVTLVGVMVTTGSGTTNMPGVPVWLNTGQTLPITGTIIIGSSFGLASAVAITTGMPSAVSTGLIVIAKDYGRNNFVMWFGFSQTIGTSATMLTFNVQTNNTTVASGTTAWAVPGSQKLRILGIQAIYGTSAAIVPAAFAVVAVTATASLSIVATAAYPVIMPVAVFTILTGASMVGLNVDISAGTTLGLGILAAGSSFVVQAVVVNGYLYNA